MKEELRRIFKSKLLIATLVAVIILPLIYGGFYLWAFWDPYGKMENLPVAIVNEDKCAQKSDKKDKEKYCFGLDLVDKLKEEKQMNWQFVNKETALSGLKNKKYYTAAIIPNNFSENIISVDSDDPQKAEIEFISRQASSFMAAKFTDTAFAKIKSALNEKISKEYFDNIFSETRDSVKDLEKAVDGVGELYDGLIDAKKGSDDLYDGIDKANSGAVDLRNGLETLHTGGETLANGANNAYTGVGSLLTGAVTINLGLNNLSTGTSQMISSTDNLNSAENAVVSYINAYITAHPEASSSAELQQALGYAQAVGGGIGQLKTGLLTANSGISQLVSGSSNLKDGLSTLSVGVSNIATGSAALRDNLGKAVDGNKELISGLEKIKDGQKDLGDGLADAVDGSKELKDKLSEAVYKSKDKTDENKNNKQTDVMSAPVNIHDISVDIVNNNGTGFTPYFLPLALWIGSMAIFFLVDLKIKRKNKFMPKFWVSMIVSTIQVLTLDLILIKVLGLTVNYLWQFIGFGLLLGFCFTLIQMFLTLKFDLAGKFIGIVFLMLQLTSDAGSYPLETTPIFFQKINPYLPMTYAVSGLRELISGDNLDLILTDSKIILVFSLIFIFLIWVCLIKKKK